MGNSWFHLIETNGFIMLERIVSSYLKLIGTVYLFIH